MAAAAKTRYDAVAMSLHWLIAVLLIFMLFFGEDLIEEEDGFERFGPSLHVSIGSTILVLSLIRLAWRLFNPPPAYPAGMASWERMAAKAMHLFFYALLMGLPLTGWLATPKFLREEGAMAGLTIFGAFPLPGAPSFGLPMKDIHELGANLGIAMLALHVLAAFKHHFIARDDILLRMLPFRRTS